MMLRSWSTAWAVICLVSLIGCQKPAAPPSTGKTDPGPTGTSPGSVESGNKVEPIGFWDDYPDVPKYAIMQEVDGIKIPRIEAEQKSIQLAGKIEADVGNPRASTPSEPVRGDAVIVRMAGEPKSLNPITETSAVQSYIMGYVNEALARQDPETFEYEPHMAERWVTEDSIKLSPDTPGKERRVKLAGGEPVTEAEIAYQAAPAGDSKNPPPPTVITVTTTDKDGQPLGGVWVGVYPKEKILGASPTGYHIWSSEQGVAELSGYPTGKYVVKVGAEIYGKSEKHEDGSLVVKPTSDENPLHEVLKSASKETLTLKPGEWVDVHQETYFTYYLRPDLTWSDGTPFTTKDIEFAYALLKNPAVDGDAIRTYYSDLVECDALSERVVRMRYRQQYFKAFEFTMGITAYAPPWHVFAKKLQDDRAAELTLEKLTNQQEKEQKKVSAHGDEFGKFFNQSHGYNRAPLGTGPYVVSRWDESERIELSRNPNYWNKERPGYLDKLVFRFIIEDNSVIQALQTGEIDFAFSLTPEQYFEVLKGPPEWLAKDFVKAQWDTPAFGYVGWNELKPQFQDRRVRIALGLLFDKERFLETKLYNAGMIVSGPAYYFGPGYDHEVKPLAYAPDIARELLTEAGWFDSNNDGVIDKDGVEFKLIAKLPKGRQSVMDRMAVLKNDLKTVGIEMEIQPLEWASFIELIQARDFDVVTLSWAMAVENDPFQIWHGSGAGKKSRGSNHVSFNNPQANDLIEMLRITLDKEKRQRIAYSFHRLIDAEQPYQFLYAMKDLGAYHQRFRGVKWYRLRPGFDLLEWYVPENEQLRKGG